MDKHIYARQLQDDPLKLVEFRGYGADGEGELFQAQKDVTYPHPHPGSVHVAAIGSLWEPDCWQAVIDMVMCHNARGYEVSFAETHITHVLSGYPELTAAKNSAVMAGRGYEYVCIIDNDVRPDMDVLSRLIDHGLPMIGPFMAHPETGEMVGFPKHKPSRGIAPVRWLSSSFMVFKTAIFNVPGAVFTPNEGPFFQHMAGFGLQAFVDTDVMVELVNPPGVIRQNEGYEDRLRRQAMSFNRHYHQKRDRSGRGREVYLPFME